MASENNSTSLNWVFPAVAGALWGGYIYKHQNHTAYDNSREWNLTKLNNKVSDWFTSGILGCITALAASSGSLCYVDSLLPKKGNPWLNRSIQVFTGLAFFYCSFPLRANGDKALPTVIKAAYKFSDFFGNLDGSITQLKCVKNIYTQPFAQNFRIAPQDFILPFIGGLSWGLFLYSKQDPLFDPALSSDNLKIQQLDEKLKTGNIGKAIAAISSSVGLFTIDQLARPFFPKNSLGKICRFSPWLVYVLMSLPAKTEYMKAISQVAFAIFYTFKITFFSLQTSLAYSEIKDIFSYKNIQEKPLNYLIPISVGAISQLLFCNNIPLTEKNSLLFTWITSPYRSNGKKFRTISNVAYLSLCFLVVYQLSTGFEGHTQKVFPKSDEERYDRMLLTWWNFIMSTGDANLLFKNISQILRKNSMIYRIVGERKEFIQYINKWNVLDRLSFILKYRKYVDKMSLEIYLPTKTRPPSEFDFTKSSIFEIFKILMLKSVGL